MTDDYRFILTLPGFVVVMALVLASCLLDG